MAPAGGGSGATAGGENAAGARGGSGPGPLRSVSALADGFSFYFAIRHVASAVFLGAPAVVTKLLLASDFTTPRM